MLIAESGKALGIQSIVSVYSRGHRAAVLAKKKEGKRRVKQESSTNGRWELSTRTGLNLNAMALINGRGNEGSDVDCYYDPTDHRPSTSSVVRDSYYYYYYYQEVAVGRLLSFILVCSVSPEREVFFKCLFVK